MAKDEDGWRQSTHEEIASLTARQAASDANISELRIEVRSVATTLEKVADSLRTQIGALTGKSTDWKAFWGAGAAVGTVIIMLAAAVITPLSMNISKNEDRQEKTADHLNLAIADITKGIEAVVQSSVRRDDYASQMKQVSDWMSKQSDRIRDDELKAVRPEEVEDLKWRQRHIEDNYVTEKQLNELKARVDERYQTASGNIDQRLNRLEQRADTTDSWIIKRPEVEGYLKAVNDRITSDKVTEDDRITAISIRMNEIQNQFQSMFHDIQSQYQAMFPPGKLFDQMWQLLISIIADGKHPPAPPMPPAPGQQ